MLLHQNHSDKLQNIHLRLIYTLLITILLNPGCIIKENTPARESNIDGETVPGAYRITLWEGGGFTGNTTGFSLLSGGRVIHWQKFKGQTDTLIWANDGHSSEIDILKMQLEESGTLQLNYNETGNITAGITYETSNKKYLWSWKHTGNAADIPQTLRNWHQKAMNFCRSLQKY